MTDADVAMLRQIARPEVAGVPGALGQVALDVLLSAGLIEFGFVAPVDGGAPTYANAWVRPTEAGVAWLQGNPAEIGA